MEEKKITSSAPKLPWLAIWVFILLALSIISASFLYFLSQRAMVLQKASNELSSIARLKVEQIESWIGERRQDAEVLRNDTLAIENLSLFLRNPADSLLRQKISTWLAGPLEQHKYKIIYLLDAAGKALLSLGEESEPIGSYAQDLSLQAIRKGEVIFSDLHRLDGIGPIHIDLLAPVSIPGDSGEQAVLLLRIDPTGFLYPMIQRWPTSSETGETMLFHVEGNEVVYLNELRHAKDTALSLRFPLTAEKLPAAMAARGERGTVEGIDYRGVAVLAAIQMIPETSWFLITEEAQAEVFAPLWDSLWLLLTFVASLILGTGAILTSFWQRRMRKYYYRQYQVEAERLVLAQRLDYLNKYANDVILLTDSEGNILEANGRALSVYGYSQEEMTKLNIAELHSPHVQVSFKDLLQSINLQNGCIFESLHKRKDGTIFPAEISTRVIELFGKPGFQSIIRNISERKQAEDKIYHLNRLYRVLSQINQMIIRTKEKRELLRKACVIAVEEGKFSLAWLGVLEGEKPEIRTVSLYKEGEGCPEKSPVYLEEMLAKWEVTTRAVREGQHQISNDLAPDPKTGLVENHLLERGCRSSATFPIRQEGSVAGAMSFFSDQAGFFTDQEIQLLSELTADLSFALDHLKEEERRERAEKELKRERDFNQTLIQSSPTFFVALDVEGKILLMNNLMLNTLGYSEEEVIGKDSLDLFVPEEEHHMLREVFGRLVERGESTKNENHVRARDGRQFLVEWYGKPICKENGELDYFIGIGIDITERKRMEEAWQKSEKQYRDLFENSPLGIYRTTPDGRVLLANPAFQRMTGYSSEELASMDLEKIGVESPHRKHFRETVEREGWVEGYESAWVRSDGGKLQVRENARVVYASDGSILYYDGTAEDVTLQKKTEEALQEERGRLLRILNTMKDGVSIISQEYELKFVNPVIEREFGPVAGRKCYDYFQGLENPCEGCDKPEASGGKVKQELFSRRTGKIYEIYDTAIESEDGSISKLMILHDITERKQIEEEIQRARTDLLYSVSHELKTPLLNLMTAQELLRSFPSERRLEAFLKHEEIWQRNIRRLGSLINNLVDSQRSQETSLPLRLESCELVELWQSVWEDQKEYTRALSVEVDFQLRDDIPPLLIDREAIGRVMTNLLSNAVKFSPKRGVVKVELGREGNYAFFSVIDQGSGISPEEQKALFQPFQRSRLARQKVVPGTGLGLYVSRRLAEAHKGSLTLESSERKGTKVILRLPISGEEGNS